MTYSYTQISQYLTCPRRYRHRYLDGWKEKDTRAAMLFGRAFERALGALFRREDPGAELFAEWSACEGQGLRYSNGDSWDRMLRQGIMLLTRFCQDDRVQVHQPRHNLQSSSPGQLARRTTSSLISMPSANATGRAACWSGKRPQADTRKSLRDCWPWIRNSFAIPG
jgi:PD-(D/E)XK nuclease superfamily